MSISIHVSYSATFNGMGTINYEAPEAIDRSLTHGMYAVLGSLATYESTAVTRAAEFDPGFSVIGQHVGLTEVLVAASVAGVAYGIHRIEDSVRNIKQQIQEKRVNSGLESSPAITTDTSVVIELSK
jgi:hypothetical protein